MSRDFLCNVVSNKNMDMIFQASKTHSLKLWHSNDGQISMNSARNIVTIEGDSSYGQSCLWI